MFSALARFPDGRTEALEDLATLGDAWAKKESIVWVDLEEPDGDAVRAVGALLALDPEAVDDCLHGEQRPRVDEFDDYLFVVLYGMLGADTPKEAFDPRKLAAFFGPRFLVTVHREPLLSVREVRDRCSRQPGTVLGKGLDAVFFSIVDGMVDKYVVVVDACERRLYEIEDNSLHPDVDESILADVSHLRHDLLEVRQVAASVRELIIPIAKGEYEYISDALEFRFSHVRDHLTQVVEQIDTQRELLTNIRDNYHAAIANRMNVVMRTLTVFASIMLPLTLVAGVYGMNVPIWPPSEEPWSFWAILAAMLVLACGLLVYFRGRKWI